MGRNPARLGQLSSMHLKIVAGGEVGKFEGEQTNFTRGCTHAPIDRHAGRPEAPNVDPYGFLHLLEDSYENDGDMQGFRQYNAHAYLVHLNVEDYCFIRGAHGGLLCGTLGNRSVSAVSTMELNPRPYFVLLA